METPKPFVPAGSPPEIPINVFDITVAEVAEPSRQSGFISTAKILRKTGVWAQFIGVMSILALIFLLMIAITVYVDAYKVNSLAAVRGIFGVLCLIFLCTVPVWCLFAYSNRVDRFHRTRHVRELDNALEALHSHFRYVGVLVALFSLIVIVALVSVIYLAVTSRPPANSRRRSACLDSAFVAEELRKGHSILLKSAGTASNDFSA